MKTLLIDVDEVICNTTFLYYINKFLKTKYKLEEIKTYYLDELVPEEQRESFYDYYLKHDVYKKANLIDGAYEGLKELNNSYNIFLYSSCVMFNREKESGKLFANKYNFIIRELPFIKPENIIFTNTKNMVVGDVQIDDRLKNLMGPVKTKVLFTAYHNHDESDDKLNKLGVIRINNWKELVEYLNK